MSDDADVRDCVWICDTCGTSSWKRWGCRCEVQALYMSLGGLDRDVTVSHAGDVIWSTEGAARPREAWAWCWRPIRSTFVP